MIEVLFQVRRDKFKDNPIIAEGLDLVEEEEQITHRIALDDQLQVQDGLSECSDCFDVTSAGKLIWLVTRGVDVFKADPDFLQNEEKYADIKNEILGDDSDEDESGSEEDSDEEEDNDGMFAAHSHPCGCCS